MAILARAGTRPLAGRRGFTLRECLIALVVLTIGIMGYMSVHYQSINGRLFSKRMQEALMSGNTNTEEMITGDFEDLAGTDTVYHKEGGNEADATDYDNGAGHEIIRSVSEWVNVTDNPNAEIRAMKTLSLTMRWKERDTVRSADVNTWVRGGRAGDSEGD